MASQARSKPQGTAEFGGKLDKLALGLAQGMSRAGASVYAGVSERTCYARLKEPAFKLLVAKHQNRMVAEAVGRLAAAGTAAADELRELLRDDSSSTRLQAAKALVDSLVKLSTFNDLSQRVADLEARFAAGEGQPRNPWEH